MKNFLRPAIYILSIALFATSCSNKKNDMTKDYPIAKKIEKKLVAHGQERIDHYFWLNDRENPEVIKYLEDENAYTSRMMKHTDKFQEDLFKEMKGRIKEQDESVPYKRNGYLYFTRYVTGGEYPVYCRKKGDASGKEEVLLDGNEMGKGHAYFNSSSVEASPDNKLGLFAIDTVGRRIYTLMFRNLETGEILPDRIENVTGSAEWAADSKTIFYARQDEETLRSNKIFKHTLGSSPDQDQLVYEEKDETFSCYIGKTKSQKYMLIFSASTLTTEARILEASNPSGEFRVFEPRERKHEYSIDHIGNQFYIVSNWNARNFRLMSADETNTGRNNWKEVIAHRDDVLLEGMELFKNHLVVSERKGGLTALRIMTWKGDSHYLDFGEAAYDAYVAYNPESETNLLRFQFNSLVTPQSTFDYNMDSKEKTLLKQQEIVGGYDASLYHSERLMAPAGDGTMVPVSLVYRKDKFKKDGSSPLLQYAYGSYGYSTDPTFSSNRLSLLDRGFVFAIAHIRGGQEMGRYWYEDGKLLKKKNTFTDFIDCSRFLIKEKYSSADRLFASGGSAGGLLMGAIVNMNPELYKGVVAAVPFVDVITTMMDASIPLTTGEYDEWGNPNDKEYYDYMLSYSPYDNVKAMAYPNMLVTTGLHDSQVQYWEPAKWVAKLRDMKTDNNLLLLHTNMDAGHGGASGRFSRLKELALEYAFIMDLAGVKK
jgi:oligopeptidase B